MPATAVAFINQPTDAITGAVVTDSSGSAIQVKLVDGLGVLVPTNGVQIDITVNAVTFSANTTLGIATFSTITVATPGTYQLSATSSGLAGALSNNFQVVTADALSFQNHPTNTIPNSDITPAIQVAIKNGGSTVNVTGVTVTINVKQGVTVIGTFTASTVAGIATFSTISVATAGTYNLQATFSTLSANSNNFTVYDATQLVFTQQPNNTIENFPLTPAVRVAVQDSLGSTLSVSVVITINVTGPSSQSVTATTVNGVATFSSITIATPGSGYGLTATVTTLSEDSDTFTVYTADSLVFTEQPSNTSTSRPIVPAVQVSVQNGSTVLPVTVVVSVALKQGVTTITTYTATTVEGVATFSAINAVNAGAYFLTATITTLSADSNAFNVIARTSVPDTPEIKRYRLTAVLLTDPLGNTIDIVATGEILPDAINTYVIAGAYRATLPTFADNSASELHMDQNGRLIVSSGDVAGDAIESQPLSMGAEAATVGSLDAVSADGAAVRLRASRSGVQFETITNSDGTLAVDLGQHNGTPFSSAPTGLVVAGQYTSSLPTLTNNTSFVPRSDVNARLLVSPDLNGIGTDDGAAPATPVGFFTAAKYTNTLPTYANGDAVVYHTDAGGRLLVTPDLNGTGTDNSAGPATPVGSFVVGQFKSTLPTYTDGMASVAHFDARGRLLVGQPQTSTLSNVGSSNSSVTLLAANANRLGAIIFNDSTANLFVKFGTTASATSFTVKIAAGGVYEIKEPAYTGNIDGIWDAVNGNARITELAI